MKQLDWLARTQNRVLVVLVVAALFVLPWGAVYFADAFWLHGLNPFLRYPLWIVSWLTAFVLTFAISDDVGKLFEWVRRQRGLKPVGELEREIDNERAVAESMTAESKRRWIETCSEGEYRYQSWLEQQKQVSQLKTIVEMLQFIVAGTVFLAVVFALWVLFPGMKNSAISECNFEATKAGIATASPRPILRVFSACMAAKGYRSNTEGFLKIAQDDRPGDWESKSYEAYLSGAAWATIWPWEPRRPATYTLLPAE